MTLALVFPAPDRRLEAAGDGPTRRAQRAYRAGQETLGDRNRQEREATQQILARLKTLQAGLRQRLLADNGSVTDFKRFTLTSLIRDTDRLIVEATADLAELGKDKYEAMAITGDSHAVEPIRAAQLNITQGLPGLDRELVNAAFGNTTDLLTMPMQQFATDVKVSLRRLATAGDNRMEEINRLRDKIEGSGFSNAAFKAERIIRTEMGRVFNTATFTRLMALSKEFPFIRKCWKSSQDNRTRLGHVQAGQTYGRGKGILIADRFLVNVYDERPGKSPKLIGQASLMFPVDPDTTPAGRIAAGATIMCRCNGFVDFNMADFASFTASKVAQALPIRPAPAAPEKPLPAVKKPPRVKKPSAIKKPKVPVPTAAKVMAPQKPAAVAPDGPKVSSAIRVQQGFEQVTAALAEIDKIHGDGNLPSIPAGKPRRAKPGTKPNEAYYNRMGSLGFGRKIMAKTPFMTVFHETGHFLDHRGLHSGRGMATDGGLVTQAHQEAMDRLIGAMKNSRPITTMANWQDVANRAAPGQTPGGDGVVPFGVHPSHLEYLLRTREVFARAYAQYITVTSNHPAAMKELRAMQLGSAKGIGPVSRMTKYNSKSVIYGQKPDADSWEYPWQWSDEDFKPIAAAFDNLMQVMGWRK